MKHGRTTLVLVGLALATSCAAAPPSAGPAQPPPPPAASTSRAPSAAPSDSELQADASAPCSAAPPPTAASVQPRRLDLDLEHNELELPAGRHAIAVEADARRYVTVGVAGPRKALVALQVIGNGSLQRLRSEVLDPDGYLPAFVSFQTGDSPDKVLLVVDVQAPVRVLRAQASVDDIAPRTRKALQLGQVAPRSLIGIPFPTDGGDGYAMEHPHRYQFARSDVVAALRAAFEQTRIRFKGNSLAIADASQWDGDRPASDLGKPRHISHRGGRDVDIALPVKHGKVSRIERRCEGVLVEQQELRCGPGTIKDVDGVRLAYFLGLLIDGPTPEGRHVPDPKKRPGPIAEVETIFTDQVYIDEIRKALEVLRNRRWIHDDAYGALGEDGLLRPSPWHTDHVHVRFRGESAEVPEVLRFAADPPPEGSAKTVVSGQQ